MIVLHQVALSLIESVFVVAGGVKVSSYTSFVLLVETKFQCGEPICQ